MCAPPDMGNCRISDPSILTRWLDGTLDADEVRGVDRHLLEGCAVCWSVLRFVGRLRELVRRRSGRSRTTARPRIVLDSAAIRAAIGIPPGQSDRREILLEIDRCDVLLHLVGDTGSPFRRLDAKAVDRTTFVPPREPLTLEVRRNAETVARAVTGTDGRLSLPLLARDPLRFVFRSPGPDTPPLTVDL